MGEEMGEEALQGGRFWGARGVPVPRPPPNPLGWSVQEPSTYREARKKLSSEKMKRSAGVPRHLPRRGAGAKAVMGHHPTAVLSLQTFFKS